MPKTITTKTAAPRTARKATATNAPGLDQTHAAQLDDESVVREYLNNLKAQFKLNWTRERVLGLVLGMLVAFGTGYLIGQLFAPLILACMASSMMFLAIVIYILAVIIAMVVGGKLGSAVYEYVSSGAARAHASGAVSTVKGWLGFGRANLATER